MYLFVAAPHAALQYEPQSLSAPRTRPEIDNVQAACRGFGLSVFALSALALFAPGAARVPGSSLEERPAATAPAFAGDFLSPLALLD